MGAIDPKLTFAHDTRAQGECSKQRMNEAQLMADQIPPQTWLRRIALLTALVLLATGLIEATFDRVEGSLWALLAITLVAVPAIWLLAHRTRAATVVALGLGVGVAGFACVIVFGASPSVAAAALAPMVVLAGAARGPAAAFLVADAIVLVGAAALGLSAGGLYTIGPGLAYGAEHPFLDLAAFAILLNAIALACVWGVREVPAPEPEGLDALQHERRQLISELDSLQSLALTGRLVANVAHEVSNPLQAMDNFLFVLLDATPEGDERRKYLLMVKQGIDRITQYLEQLSDFYRPTESTSAANISQTIEDVFRFLERQLRNANVKVSHEFESDLPDVGVSEERMRQIVLNVVLNAVEAMPEGGDISVSCFREGDAVRAVFEDTGCGIAPGVLERIFDPFFTTKSEQGGTGLGLSISQRILGHHGGSMVAESTPGLGTRIILNVPVASDAPGPDRET